MSLQQVTDAFELPLLRLSMLLRPSRWLEDAHLLLLRLRRCRRMLLVMLPRVPTPPSSSELQGLHSTTQHDTAQHETGIRACARLADANPVAAMSSNRDAELKFAQLAAKQSETSPSPSLSTQHPTCRCWSCCSCCWMSHPHPESS
jgi:hypothetical protein